MNARSWTGLEHPNIARLLDGGTLPDGRPYLVMEHIDALPIDTFCDERCLPIRERLQILRKVCEAVAYAHRNLVVHRDLKTEQHSGDDRWRATLVGLRHRQDSRYEGRRHRYR